MSLEQLNFQSDVLDLSHDMPVLADFWAPWCAPCRMLAPVLERLAGKYAGSWKLVKINTEEHPELADRYGVRGIPDVKLFINGEVADEFSGALSEQQVELWLKKAIPGRYEKEIGLAGAFIKEGKTGMAVSLLEGVLQKEPENSRARALLLHAVLFAHPEEALRLCGQLEGEPEYMELCDTAGVIIRLLQLRPEDLPVGAVRERYLQALRELAARQFDAALVAFIDVLREDRPYDSDGSRKACIAIFRYLGEEHDITRKHRKAFDRSF